MNTMKLAASVVCVGITVLVGCDSTTEERYDDVSIQTDQQEYLPVPGEVMTFTIMNLGNREVYLECGGYVGLEQWSDGHLRHAWGTVGAQCLGVNSLAPSEQKVVTWGFSDSYFASGPTPDFSKDVRYRFRVLIYEDKGLKNLIDDESQRSNEFEILSEASLERE